MLLHVNSQHYSQFTALCTILHFVLPIYTLHYSALCTIGIVFACAIKMDKISVFYFKLAQKFVILHTG